MNYFRLVICGESELSHDELGDLLSIPLVEEVEKRINGVVGIATYTPIDESGEPLNEETKQAIAESFDHPEKGVKVEDIKTFLEVL